MEIHPAIAKELEMLKERFPGKNELTLDEYAEYFGISRHYASQHFNRVNESQIKIDHKRIGKAIIIPFIDFAYWLACHKTSNGMPLVLPSLDVTRQGMKQRRGFSMKPDYGNYRKLG